jgi:formate hydrogenlyase transcriptional activator
LELEPFSPRSELNLPISSLAEMQRDHILRALETSNWVIGGRKGAAERLSVKRTSLLYRMRKLRISLRAAVRESMMSPLRYLRLISHAPRHFS